MPPRKRETPMEWFSKSMGFVDKVCCYSYSQEQIYSESSNPMEQVDMNSICMPPSWDMEDSSISDDHHHAIWKNNDRTGRDKSSNRYPQKQYRSPARSVSTSTTVTTSTAPTVVTSCRTIQSGDNSITSQQRWSAQEVASRRFHHDTFRSERRRAQTPNHIYCHSHSDGELYHGVEINSATSRSYSRVPFTAATEGFQC